MSSVSGIRLPGLATGMDTEAMVKSMVAKRDGIAIEELGSYNPLGEKEVHIDAEAAKKWLSNGAQPTETVKALFKKNGIM